MENQPEIMIYEIDLEKKVMIPFYDNYVHAGDPNDVGDISFENIDLPGMFIRHPGETYGVVVQGDSMINAGFNSGDIAIVDRFVTPQNGDIIVASIEDEFTLKRYKYDSHKNIVVLTPENDEYDSIIVNKDTDFRIFGVVSYSIHNHKRRNGITVMGRFSAFGTDKKDELSADFEDCILNQTKKKETLRLMHLLLDGRRGKYLGLITQCAVEKGLILKPTYQQMLCEFGEIGSKAGYHRYMNYAFTDAEKEPIKVMLP